MKNHLFLGPVDQTLVNRLSERMAARHDYPGVRDMPHEICTADGSDGLSYLEGLWSLLLAPDRDMRTKLERVFATESEQFQLDYAFLARIDRDTETEHFELVHAPDERIETNESVSLACTYCRKTIAASDETMAISDALAEGWDDDPAYERFGFRSYVGTTVSVEGELYGTLCFADTDPRDEPIVDEEVTLVRMIGRWVTYELNQWTGPPTHDTISHELGGSEILRSPQIDSVMDALAKRPRRLVLLALLDETGEKSLTALEQATDCDLPEVELQHVHFPKLDQAGYIDWDRDAGRLSSGPNFSEIEPFLRLLAEYTAECSR